ncbi:pickpocket protein 28-like [Amphibalanus amphitrite]|uniref:pickpocket protein 28-like n=1 Tax=Amphibalanus amphitrite TaxID=1232801 RepID=UPI001C900296|nr:pickpocket protein 28-like [Amphibalanus amphitrite]
MVHFDYNCHRLACYWLAILLAMVIASGYFIYRVVITYYYTPTLLSIDNTDYPVHRLRFPALTVCNMNKIDSRRMPPDQQQVLGRVVFANDTEWHERVEHVLENIYATTSCEGDQCHELYDEEHFTTEQVLRIIELTSPSCEEMISACSWRNTPHSCKELFEPLHTDFGYCCVFNADFEHQHGEHAKEDKHTGAGYTNGLSMMLDARRYEYSHSQYLSVGFKVLIHAPYDEPEVRERGLAIQPGNEMFISITAEHVYTTDEALHSFTPEQRNCFEQHEVELEFADTHVYTLSNCLLSHLTARIHDGCGCVAHYMPDNASKDLRQSEEAWRKCLPACDEIKYLPYTSSSEFPSRELISHPSFGDTVQLIVASMCKAVHHDKLTLEEAELAALCDAIASGQYPDSTDRDKLAALLSGATEGHLLPSANEHDANALYAAAVRYARANMVKVHAYFKSNSITRYKRGVLYTTDQLVANVGGLLGLFLGFSIVSIAEILYFVTIKLLTRRTTNAKVKASHGPQEDDATIAASFVLTNARDWRPKKVVE